MKRFLPLLILFLIPGVNGFGQATSPNEAAPTPPDRNAEDVISIYSDAYTDISIGSFSADFDDSSVEEVMIDGNATLKIDFTNFLGIDFSNNKQDASQFTHFHLDFWTSSTDLDGKVFNSKFSQWGGGDGEVSAFELPINTATTPAIESGTWVSIDVPISAWTNAPQTRDDLAQFILTSNLDIVFVDNIYLYKEAAVTPSDAELGDLQIDGETIPGFSKEVINYTYGIVEGTTTIPQITLATPTNENATVTITQATALPGDATVVVVSEDESTTTTYTVTFSSSPTVAAPTPPARNAEDVISIFSDAYTDIDIDTFSATADDSSVEEVMIDGNATKKIDFTNYLQVEFINNRIDASEMTNFHMDFWFTTSDLTGKVFNSKFVDFGGGDSESSALELNINGGTEPNLGSGGVWVSVDVSLDSWVNQPNLRSDLAQFVLTSNLDVVYVDNIYLWKEVSTSTDDQIDLPKGFSLNQNYPNPFNPTTNISFSIPVSASVSLEVYNIQGQKVATLVDGFKSAGSYTVSFDASYLASGLYTYRLISNSSVQVKKMMLLK